MTIRTAPAARTSVMPKGLRVGAWPVTSTFSLGAGQSLSAGDIIQMIRVPANASVVYLAVLSTNGDTSFGVGDDVSVNRYLTTVTRSTAQGWLTINQPAPGYTYSTEDTIDLGITLASITSIVGGFQVRAILSMDPGNYGP